MQINIVTQHFSGSKYGDIYETGLTIFWSKKEYETMPITHDGELHISVDDDGNVQIDTESMGKDHFLKLMELLYDKAEVK